LGNEDDLESTMKVVDIFTNKTPFENAKYYYDIRANMIEKEKKTQEATDLVLKQAKEAAEKKIKKKEEQVKAVKINRKTHWFEKFYWFISSENYLVISARDAQQNETLIKKYMAKNDVVFHTQVQGSAFTLVKNPKTAPIPHQTLQEAAQATLCHSRCWTQKVVTEVFYVYPEQVTKTAPSGLFVGVGSFMIYGKKNFITPSRLEMGFGLIWKVDEESVKNHEGERVRRDEGNEAGADLDDPDRLIKHASSIKENNPKPVEQKLDEAEGSSVSLQADGSDGEDPDGNIKLSVHQSSHPTIQRELTIAKDTDSYFVNNPISNTKSSAKIAQQQKKKAKEEKKAGKDDKTGTKKGQSQPEKPQKALETIDVKKSQQMSKNKKKRLEKIAEKYGEMDEEERLLQMQMLGSKPMKLSKDQQKELDRKIKETRGERVDEEGEEETKEEVKKESEEEESEEEKETKGKSKDKGQKKGNDKAAKGQQKNDKAGGKGKDGKVQNTKQEKPVYKDGKSHAKPQQGKAGDEPKNKDKVTPAAKPPEVTLAQASAPDQQTTLPKVEPAEKPKEPEVKPKAPEEKAKTLAANDEGDEEMEDLDDGLDDGEDEPVDEAAENKKETMSILNTVLDEEAEKNLNEILEFKQFTGIPKNTGRKA
jgi:hypothetical protein